MMTIPARYPVKVAETSAIFWWWYNEAYRDDRHIGMEDLVVSATAVGGVTWVWKEEIFAITLPAMGATLLAVEAIVLAGAVGAYAVGGTAGVEDYGDFIFSGPEGWYKKTKEVTVPAIQENITEPVIDYITEELWQKQLVDPIGGWLNRRERELRHAWEITRPRAPSWL